MSSVVALWVCIGLFFTRVVGQVEVLLLEPAWLPPMSAWYSGLLPYPLLLPLQIALLMVMSVLALRAVSARPTRSSHSGVKVWRTLVWRILALLYFAVMAVRLVLCVSTHGAEFYLHGAVPIAFHWVLALFALVCARLSGATPGWTAPAERRVQ